MNKRFYRKILEVINTKYDSNGTELDVKIVHWCGVDSETTRTTRTTHVACSVYINGKFKGVSARHPQKAVSIRFKKPLESKYYVEGYHLIESLQNEAFSRAFDSYCVSLGRVSGEVRYFDESRGQGMVRCDVTGRSLPVYACNIKGAKTWYPETACITLERGQKITFEHHSHCGACSVEGGTLDAEKWDSLDQNKLAFKCDENGKAINGLFATKGGENE